MVRYLERPDGESRFGMLETIGAYGLELLTVSGDVKTIRQLHADFFLALAEATEPDRTDMPILAQRLLPPILSPLARLFGYRAIYKKYSGFER